MAGTVSIKGMPPRLAEHIASLAEQVWKMHSFLPLGIDLLPDHEQGSAPDWYTDPGQFRSVIHVGEWLVLDDHKEEGETDEQVISALLSEESDEHYLDIFPIDEYPGVSLAVLVESRGQWGTWFTGLGVLTSLPEFEEYLLREHSYVIGGGHCALEVLEVVRHNLNHNK
ncbi:MAG: hypothetical protein HWE20_04220 [Gammaproteobacteria bacterium]|nr:hypothetical protein [Gammaproteobacteria bacterium]